MLLMKRYLCSLTNLALVLNLDLLLGGGSGYETNLALVLIWHKSLWQKKHKVCAILINSQILLVIWSMFFSSSPAGSNKESQTFS